MLQPEQQQLNLKAAFPPPFRLTAEQRLLDFCTNEIGILLFGSGGLHSGGIAIVGNPLRIVSDELNGSNKPLNWSGNTPTTLEVNCSEKYLALAAGPTLSVFDLQKCSVLREFHDHDGPVNGVAWHRESPWLLASVGADCALRLWDLRSHPAQIGLRRAARPYRRLEYSPDCNYIACAGQSVSIYDLNMAQSVVHMPSTSVANHVLFNPAECLLATAHDDRTVRFWDVDTGECVTQSPAFDCPIAQMRFEPQGQFLVVGTAKQISCIHWEPFELISQLNYPIPAKSPSLSTIPSMNEGPQINLLDMRVHKDRLHQLAIVSPDPSKTGIACLATIQFDQLEKCGNCHSQPIAPASLFANPQIEEEVQLIPACPTSSAQIELGEEEDLSPESVASTAESMLDSLVLHDYQQEEEEIGSNLESPLPVGSPIKTKSPYSAPTHRKMPTMGQIKKGISSLEIAGTSSIPSKTAQSHGHSSLSAGASAAKIRQKKQQQQEGNTPLKRPDRLSVIQQQHSAGTSSSPNPNRSITHKLLIRRGNSLNDVANSIPSPTKQTPTPPHNNCATMPISSAAKSRSQSHARSHFSSSTASSSSSASSNSTSSSIGGNGKSNYEDGDIEEFTQISKKVRTVVQKIMDDIQGLLANVNNGRHGNIAFDIAGRTGHLDEPHVFAKLLKTYMSLEDSYNLELNASFLHRVNILLGHRNKTYIQLALDFLHMVVTSFGESIRHGLASQEYNIGVDVEAEGRYERCIRCRNALFQIQLNSSFYIDRLDKHQRQRFERTILPLIELITSDTTNKSPANG